MKVPCARRRRAGGLTAARRPPGLRCPECDSDQIAADEAIRVTIPAGVAHAIMNTGDKPSAIVSFSTESYNREEPDVVREVLIEM